MKMHSAKICVLLTFLFIFFTATITEAATHRLYGSNRYETAVEISRSGWDAAHTVLIARGDDFPDALAGTPLAYQHDAPILLTQPNSLNPLTAAEVDRLGAKKAIILGGYAAVSQAVEDQLTNMGLTVERIGGTNRYETAQLIAENMPSSNTAIIAYGQDFPDALSIASYAAINGYPILLSTTDSLPSATQSALTGISNTIVIGGSRVISNSVLSSLPEPQRIAGSSRFETVEQIFQTLDISTDKAYIATALNFADALTGSALAAKEHTAILLVQPEQIPQSIQTIVNDTGITKFTILGGEKAVSANAVNLLASALNPPLPERIQRVFDLTNLEREKHGLAPLQYHAELSEVAEIKSKDMYDNQYFDHNSPIYGSPFDMMSHYGISYTRAAENLAAGFLSPQTLVNAWMNSPGHRANILNPNLTHIGIGYYYNANDPSNLRHYWTQMFIAPQ
ncbi:cell wall-binding repeat-containing protein [Dethiobacter alkaliphilus]|uniref:SCP-like extracellular n=1 Tax=Dethiobacter alkaliphilus AHT 1 TaxID=555088 RepID=C0GGL9_DETAL|nr:cell wall-binding repeat-containing protein [Dethiobacter alkaliphilus]EEG77460.1 SCP-like extracellular [Dethiobacter alkaliphilus AHT 1]